MSRTATPTFSVVSGEQVRAVLAAKEPLVVDLVRRTYLAHDAGLTANPPSYFLRFEDRPAERIIALPASISADNPVNGIKWIASVPSNIERGLPRASAVAILNDPASGYPYACMESSIISAARTAASAALAADVLSRSRKRPRRLGIVGAGLIARHVHQYLAGTGWDFDAVGVFDIRSAQADAYVAEVRRADCGAAVRAYDDVELLIADSDLVVFATVAAEPHVWDTRCFEHAPLVLNISLRDLGPEIILSAVNVVDDVEHCLKANTSVHVVEQQVGHRRFLAGTLADVLRGHLAIPADRTVVFSPFGLGVLDLAVAKYVYDELESRAELHAIQGFFHDPDRALSLAGPHVSQR